jgi:uncharacterized protein YjbI with pentapeptide repeats
MFQAKPCAARPPRGARSLLQETVSSVDDEGFPIPGFQSQIAEVPGEGQVCAPPGVYTPSMWSIGHLAAIWVPVAIALYSVLVSLALFVCHLGVPEAIKATTTLLGMIGMVLTGVYAYRKQRLVEAESRRADAAAARGVQAEFSRRFSEALTLLGDRERAAVRIGGAYAMARLADDWTEQRQTCVDVLCAYLRMSEPASEEAWNHRDRRQETQVRETVLRLLQDHYHKDAPIPWHACRLDLTGARMQDVDFRGACFSGTVSFQEASFENGAVFIEARFSDESVFTGVHFHGEAVFAGAQFDGDTDFTAARFDGVAGFDGAQFNGVTSFERVHFDRGTAFNTARFLKDTNFANTCVTGYAGFARAHFDDCAGFAETHFDGGTSFDGTHFERTATFVEVHFDEGTDFAHSQFVESADFVGAHFEGGTDFSGVYFAGEADFSETRFEGNTIFDDTCFQNVAVFTGAQVTADVSFTHAHFEEYTDFSGAFLTGRTTFRECCFLRIPRFDGTIFTRVPETTGMTVEECPEMSEVSPLDWPGEEQAVLSGVDGEEPTD